MFLVSYSLPLFSFVVCLISRKKCSRSGGASCFEIASRLICLPWFSWKQDCKRCTDVLILSFSVLWNHVVLKRDQFLTCITYRLQWFAFPAEMLDFFRHWYLFCFLSRRLLGFPQRNLSFSFLPSSLPFRFFLQCVFSYFWVEWSPQILVAPLKLSSGSFSRYSVLQMA